MDASPAKLKKDKKVKKVKKDKKDKKAKKEKKEKKRARKAAALAAAAAANGAGGSASSSDDSDSGDAPAAPSPMRMRTRSFEAKLQAQKRSAPASTDGDDAGAPVARATKRARTGTPADTARVHRMRTRSFDKSVAANGAGSGSGAGSAALVGPGASAGQEAAPFTKFRISEQTQESLKKRGITHLFPIQAMAFDPVYDGQDVVGRARTGMGKTLAFVLPIVERIFADNAVSTQYGRKPLVLGLAPTRELAKQVALDFESVSGRLQTLSVYGGTPMYPQTATLRRGVDVIVGTPGRVIDHIERGNLDVSQLKYLVLDEADQMLDMGFKDDMETIMSHIPALANCKTGAKKTPGTMQTLLFSATIPSWVREVSTKYMHEPHNIDLIGDANVKASKDVQHLMVQCPWQNKAATIGDLIKVYGGPTGRILVFCDTKREANEMVVHPAIKMDCQALHGDISQSQRETTLEAFRAGTVRCVIATDVAARGLDIKGVDLVIQLQPPAGKFTGKADVETYVHRSGRTGRAGRQGVAITLYTRNQEGTMKEIERKTGNTFTRVGAPQPADLVKASAVSATMKLEAVPAANLAFFEESAKKVLAKRDAVEALSAALACMAGYTKAIARRSLMSASDGFFTVVYKAPAGTSVRTATFVWNALREELPPHIVDSVRGMTLMSDATGAAFDLPENFFEQVEAAVAKEGSNLTVCTELPELVAAPQQYGGRSGRGGRWGGGGGRRGGGRGGRGRFGGGGRGRFGGGRRGGGRGRGRGRGRW